MTQKLVELVQLTQVVLDGEMARLQEISVQVNQVRAQIAELKKDRRVHIDWVGKNETDSASVAGQGLKWLDWVQKEQGRLNRELSKASALFEAQREKTRIAFGRADAVKKLNEKSAMHARKEKLARM